MNMARGPLLGFKRDKVDFTTYWPSPGSKEAVFVFAEKNQQTVSRHQGQELSRQNPLKMLVLGGFLRRRCPEADITLDCRFQE
jgi:hypothetical protein